MWFKNLQIYRFTQPFALSPEALHEALAGRRARECGSLEASTEGWFPPLGRDAPLMVHTVGDCTMICTRREQKVLPAAVVNEALDERISAIEESEGRTVRRRERNELKDELVQQMLPQAFSRSSLTYAYVDAAGGWLVVDAASAKRAEEVISLLRETLGTLRVKPLESNLSPVAVMTSWLKGEAPPQGFKVLDECELRDMVEEGGVVRCRRQDLRGKEIKGHLDAGKQVVKLAVELTDRLSFVMTEELAVKRLKFLDLIQEEAAESEAEDEASRFDVDFALMSLELGRFIPAYLACFGGIPSEA